MSTTGLHIFGNTKYSLFGNIAKLHFLTVVDVKLVSFIDNSIIHNEISFELCLQLLKNAIKCYALCDITFPEIECRLHSFMFCCVQYDLQIFKTSLYWIRYTLKCVEIVLCDKSNHFLNKLYS